MTDTIKLNVNGIEHSVTAEADTPLLYILRNDLQLKGTRFGCGLGQCGACNVLIDGRNVQSCDTPLWAAAGKRITTIEGLGTPQRLHPLQQAFIDEQAAQCGYCASGIIMSAKALLDRNPNPGEDEIRAALDRNLCRCGTHTRIVRAIRRAARSIAAGTPR
ncbi:MAG: (2Fe-2S)-binding protein [Betaproteobacteria bacterium]|nr:(2Fe-2S)-binding protein [Betaproteobacteria bacterium]MBI3055715.1 (2Fe-2S)-binding protein [Betaproteobacteria bacterium]